MRLLGVALGSLLLLSAGAARAASVEDAARAASRGETEKARHLLAGLVGEGLTNPRALFVQGCVELEAGHFDVVRGIASKISRLSPYSPEPRLLIAMAERRKAKPKEPWLEAATAAWIDAGRPPGSRLLPEDARPEPLSRDELTLSDETEQGFLVQFGENAPTSYLVPRALTLAESRSKTVRLAAVAVLLSPLVPGNSQEQAKLAAHRALWKLALEEPQNGVYGVWALMEPAELDAPLGETEALLLLAWIRRADRVALPLAELHDGFEAAYAVVDRPQASARGLGASMTAMPMPTALLLRRARAAIEEGGPGALVAADLLRVTGMKLLGAPSLVERMAALLLLDTATTVPQFAKDAEAISQERDRLKRLADVSRRFSTQFGRWPIGPLQREIAEAMTHAELAQLSRLATDPPELSAP